MPNVFISTIPFASNNQDSLKLLEENDLNYLINPLGRKVTEDEIKEYIKNCDGLIAGTEPLNEYVLSSAKNLKVISRVGVGTDNIDLDYAKSKNISIEITRNGLTDSVAEYTLSLILNVLKGIHQSNTLLKKGVWQKSIGREISECNIGIVGAGNIGQKLLDLLDVFKPRSISYFDPYIDLNSSIFKKTTLQNLLKESDIISLHLPLTKDTESLISKKEIELMKSNSFIINTSRGAIIDEYYLIEALENKTIGGAALDVYTEEPYFGKLTKLDNCLVTPHNAPMTEKARESMEYDSVLNVIKHLSS